MHKDVCMIAGTNAGKKLIYQSISIIISEFVLVISLIITLIEDQFYITPKMRYYYCLYLVM